MISPAAKLFAQSKRCVARVRNTLAARVAQMVMLSYSFSAAQQRKAYVLYSLIDTVVAHKSQQYSKHIENENADLVEVLP